MKLKLCPLGPVCPCPGAIYMYKIMKKKLYKIRLQRDFFLNFSYLQQMTEVTRCSCWLQNSVPKGLSALALALYTCIKFWKKMYKIWLQRDFFETCSKWPKWQKVSVDIKFFSTGVVCPWPAATCQSLYSATSYNTVLVITRSGLGSLMVIFLLFLYKIIPL